MTENRALELLKQMEVQVNNGYIITLNDYDNYNDALMFFVTTFNKINKRDLVS